MTTCGQALWYFCGGRQGFRGPEHHLWGCMHVGVLDARTHGWQGGRRTAARAAARCREVPRVEAAAAALAANILTAPSADASPATALSALSHAACHRALRAAPHEPCQRPYGFQARTHGARTRAPFRVTVEVRLGAPLPSSRSRRSPADFSIAERACPSAVREAAGLLMT